MLSFQRTILEQKVQAMDQRALKETEFPGATVRHTYEPAPCLTLFADDQLGHWTLKTVQDMQQIEAFMLNLFRLLALYGLKVNPEKSSMVIRVHSTKLQK